MNDQPHPDWVAPDANLELAARRTGMSFQRTRMSADSTLMSVIRTSLSLIGFGFTIFQAFKRMRDAGLMANDTAPRHFGMALVALGLLTLVIGMVYHLWFMAGLRATRRSLRTEHLIHGQSPFPPSMTLIVALALLAIGVLAVLNMAFGVSW
jgi:putative membrane protein